MVFKDDEKPKRTRYSLLKKQAHDTAIDLKYAGSLAARRNRDNSYRMIAQILKMFLKKAI